MRHSRMMMNQPQFSKCIRHACLKKTGVWCLLLIMALILMAGCAARMASQPPPQMAQSPSESQGPVVARFEDGRLGFYIRENSVMDDAVRADFVAAVALLNDAQFEPASVLLEKVVAQAPGVTAPYINLALAYHKLGRRELAEAQLKTALEIIPDHPVACNLYGLLCRESGRFEEAREMYEKTLVRFPDYYPVHRNLGILCDLYLDDPACAIEHYQIYEQAKPDDQQVRMWIADLQARSGGS